LTPDAAKPTGQALLLAQSEGDFRVPFTTTQNQISEFIRTVAQSPQSALLLDYDGTLAPFSVDRQSAVPYPGVIPVLQEIVDTGRTRLVIITGRNAHDIDPLLDIRPFPEVWGSHGLQRLRPDGTVEMPELDPKALQALEDAERWLSYQGLHHMAEPKPGSIAVHWRALDENSAIQLRGRILLGWFPIAESASLRVLEFDGGLELRVPDKDKSDAVRTILQEIGPRVPAAYLGDDVTDELAFRAMQRGLTVLVRREPRKTAARAWLRPPEELLQFLRQWRDACRTNSLVQSATYTR
jgi:trehalose 6-phosphate phosphatase